MSAVRVRLPPKILNNRILKTVKLDYQYIQANKSLSWIPWHSEAMKGVSTNEMLRGAGRKL